MDFSNFFFFKNINLITARCSYTVVYSRRRGVGPMWQLPRAPFHHQTNQRVPGSGRMVGVSKPPNRFPAIWTGCRRYWPPRSDFINQICLPIYEHFTASSHMNTVNTIFHVKNSVSIVAAPSKVPENLRRKIGTMSSESNLKYNWKLGKTPATITTQNKQNCPIFENSKHRAPWTHRTS